MYANDSYVLEALQCGAMGYVLKDCRAMDLTRAIREALAGWRYLSPPLSDRIINDYVSRNEVRASDPYDWLTPREKEVLQLVAEGHCNAAIASRLSLSVRTVETHRGNFMRKLGLHNQADVAAYAIRHGIIAPWE
jgi:DNA-binding NarL/FixJ family response regulator